MVEWICVACGAKHDANKPPCRKCAGEQLAKLEDKEIPDRIEKPADIQWECKSCGEFHVKNSPPCRKCGGMEFESFELDYTEETNTSVSRPSSSVTNGKSVATIFGNIGWDTNRVGRIRWLITGVLFLIFPPLGLLAIGWYVAKSLTFIDQNQTQETDVKSQNPTKGEKIPGAIETSDKTSLTAKTMVVYLVGLVTIIIGWLYIASGSILMGISVSAAGVITVPYTRRFTEDEYNIKMSSGAVFVIWLLGWIVGIGLYNLR